MSSSHQNLGPDPSMEEILSSIRRILREDGGMPEETAQDRGPAGDDGEAGVIDAAEEDAAGEDSKEEDVTEEDASAVFVLDPSMLVSEAPARATPRQPVPEPPLREPARMAPVQPAADPGMMLARGGPTLDEIVRDEIRPLLQAWLDSNLPAMIDRIAREEIARLIDQSRQ